MRVNADIVIGAPPERVWETVCDPSRALHYMAGVTRWEVVGDTREGLGARYRMLMRVGSAEIGGLIEVVEFVEGRDLAWVSITGVDQRGQALREVAEDARAGDAVGEAELHAGR